MATVARRTKNFNPAKNVAALLSARGRQGMGVRFGELLSLCVSDHEVHRMIGELRDGGWRIGEKDHANGESFWFAISDPSNFQFPTKHFGSGQQTFEPLRLAAQPAARGAD